MNTKYRRVPTEFAPETRFELRPIPPAPFRATLDTHFEELKTRLVQEKLDEALIPEWTAHLRRAANEAAALAWVTPYPLLVFPELFEEKATNAILQAEHQKKVFARSRVLLAV